MTDLTAEVSHELALDIAERKYKYLAHEYGLVCAALLATMQPIYDRLPKCEANPLIAQARAALHDYRKLEGEEFD